MTSKPPIFIVGAPRSGTTLLAAMLAAHSQMSCGPETHFFRWLAKTDPSQMCQFQQWPTPAVDFICSITHRRFSPVAPDNASQSLIDKYHLDRAQIEQFLASRKPAIPNILAAVTEQHMRILGKRRWVEKTPDHIEHVHSIRAHFPNSPIIRILRDPRDVALSLMRVPWGAETYLEALLFRTRLDDASSDFFVHDPLAYTLCFEDILSEPQRELARLCQFIDEEFEAGMLDTSRTGKQVNSRNAPWKDKASQPVDISRIHAWRRILETRDIRLAEALLGDRLQTYNYPLAASFSGFAEIFPQDEPLTEYVDAPEIIITSEVRLWKIHKEEKSAAAIYLGDPGESTWLDGTGAHKARAALGILRHIVGAIITGKRLYWIPKGDIQTWTGSYAYLLKKLLNSYKALAEVRRESESSL